MLDINRLVAVRDDEGREYLSRVEDSFPGWLVLARPLDLPALHSFATGEWLYVTWADQRGLTVAAGRLVETRLEGVVALWVVELNGEAWREQRRQYVRVAVSGPVHIRLGPAPGKSADAKPADAEPSGDAILSGQLCDLSEAAVRCTMAADVGSRCEPSLPATVHFEVGGDGYELAGQILKQLPSPRSDKHLDVVIVFDLKPEKADALRRTVFAEQLRIRNGLRNG
jgi:hypothetical protein